MAASCSLVCCGEENDLDKAAVVRFSHGIVRDAESLDFTMYKHVDVKTPRKRNKRMLVAESERLSYVGSNFGTGSMKGNNLCKYYVGVLNKETMKMEVHSAQLFNMHPVIPGEVTETATAPDSNQTYREKVDSLIEAFGTNKQKKALNSRRLNQVGPDALNQAVAKAATSVIEQKGLEVLQQEVAESQEDPVLYLPPFCANASKAEDVYPFDGLLSPGEFSALEQAGSKMAALTSEELEKMKYEGRCLSVVKFLVNLPPEGKARDKMARCAFYLSLLLKLSHLRNLPRKFGKEEDCPRMIQTKIFRTFTVETFKNGSVQNMVSASMRVKVAAFCLALLLHMGNMTVDLTLLHRDLGIPEARMVELAKSMGLTLLKSLRGKAEDGMSEEQRQASLVLPLVKYDKFTERRKSRIMR